MKIEKEITYEGWLNEEKMNSVLTEVVKELNGELLPCGYAKESKKYKEGTQVKLLGSRSHYDFGFTYKNIEYLVEFDGNYQGVGHYNNAENCYKDDKKNELALKKDIKLSDFLIGCNYATRHLKSYLDLIVAVP